MRALIVALLLLAAVPSAAQVQSRPTDPPLVTAVNEQWYLLGEPVQFAGELYYRAGAAVFFNGNTMVRTGHYNAVPLYTDTTVEPFSVVLVPIGRGLMQPYERRRSGDLAGTTGSRPPSFPVRTTPEMSRPPVAAASPTAPPLPPGAISVYTPERGAIVASSGRPAAPRAVAAPVAPPEVVGTTGVTTARRSTGPPLLTLLQPQNNDGVWIRYGGARWVSAGAALPITATHFVRVGEYAGRPVFTRADRRDDVIYVTTREGIVAPYKRKN